VPAKVLRYRFDEETIGKIEKTQWWKLKPEDLKDLITDSSDVQSFLKVFVADYKDQSK